jgi:MFS family permease
MLALTLVTVTGFGGFAALFSVVPLWAAHGGQGAAGTGLVTGVLLMATIATQPFVPALTRRCGQGVALCLALVLLGGPSVAFGLSDQLPAVLALSAARGIGFGILTVSGSTVVAELVPASRRGEAIGIYGLAIALPNLVLLPGCVAIAEKVGYWWVFGLGAVPLLGLPAALRLGRVMADVGSRRPGSATEPGVIHRDVLTRTAPPALVLLAVTLAGGALMTFLPQVAGSTRLSVVALLALGLCAALSRWLVGRIADRLGPQRMTPPLLVVTAAGLTLSAVSLSGQVRPWLLILGMVVVGIGYGALQNLTLMTVFSRVRPLEYGAASAVWNVGFDAGTGLGAMVVGLIATASTFTIGFLVMAALALAALPLAGRPFPRLRDVER